jgi:hypothetical protein
MARIVRSKDRSRSPAAEMLACNANLRQTYASFQAKSDELGQLKGFFSRYDQLLIERQVPGGRDAGLQCQPFGLDLGLLGLTFD